MGDLLPTRRQFIVGAAATAMLAGCGNDDDGSNPSGQSELSVIQVYGPYFAAGMPARVPFSLADSEGPLPASALPDSIEVSITDDGGDAVGDTVTADLHVGLARPYYAFRATPPTPGFYTYTADVAGAEIINQFVVLEPDDPAIAARIGPGDDLPALETPTVANPRGVTPVCTRDPMCGLHDRTVAEVLGQGPLALMVATPAYCQTAICGPVVDLLVEAGSEFPDVTLVHAEVYRNPSENSVPPEIDEFAPVVTELGLPYEPVLYLVDADGVVVERLDYIFDGSEIRSGLNLLV